MKDQPNIIYIVCHGLERMKAVTIMDFNPPIFLDSQARSRSLMPPSMLPSLATHHAPVPGRVSMRIPRRHLNGDNDSSRGA